MTDPLSTAADALREADHWYMARARAIEAACTAILDSDDSMDVPTICKHVLTIEATAEEIRKSVLITEQAAYLNSLEEEEPETPTIERVADVILTDTGHWAIDVEEYGRNLARLLPIHVTQALIKGMKP